MCAKSSSGEVSEVSCSKSSGISDAKLVLKDALVSDQNLKALPLVNASKEQGVEPQHQRNVLGQRSPCLLKVPRIAGHVPTTEDRYAFPVG